MFIALKNLFRRKKKELVKPIIDVVVTSNGLFGGEIVADLKKSGYAVTKEAENVLSDVVSTTGISYRVGLFKLEDLPYGKITYPRVCRFGKKNGCEMLPVEVGSILVRKVSSEKMKTHDITWVGCVSESVKLNHAFEGILSFGRNPNSTSLWFGSEKTFLMLGEMGAIPQFFRQGGAFAFLMPNPNKG